mmetsp:Transcript_2650/g.8500  ORF Transcript_2650/g.8500 Transcript_2650/m.8500 type:complete len:243 (+) Transcript_2650:1336-2064(+)
MSGVNTCRVTDRNVAPQWSARCAISSGDPCTRMSLRGATCDRIVLIDRPSDRPPKSTTCTAAATRTATSFTTTRVGSVDSAVSRMPDSCDAPGGPAAPPPDNVVAGDAAAAARSTIAAMSSGSPYESIVAVSWTKGKMGGAFVNSLRFTSNLFATRKGDRKSTSILSSPSPPPPPPTFPTCRTPSSSGPSTRSSSSSRVTLTQPSPNRRPLPSDEVVSAQPAQPAARVDGTPCATGAGTTLR